MSSIKQFEDNRDWFGLGQFLKQQIFKNEFVTTVPELENVGYAVDPDVLATFIAFCGGDVTTAQIQTFKSKFTKATSALDTLSAFEFLRGLDPAQVDSVLALLRRTQSVVAKFLLLKTLMLVAAADNGAGQFYEYFKELIALSIESFCYVQEFVREVTMPAFAAAIVSFSSDLNAFRQLQLGEDVKEVFFGNAAPQAFDVRYKNMDLHISVERVVNLKLEVQIVEFLLKIPIEERNNLDYSVVAEAMECDDNQIEEAIAELVFGNQIKATIDEVAKKIFVEYVKPITLDDEGCLILEERIDDVISRVDELEDILGKVIQNLPNDD